MVELYLFRVVQDHIFKDRDQGLNLQLKYVHTGVSGCEQGFITCFLEVPLASLSSMAAAVQPHCLWNSQKTCYKTFSTT